MYMIYGYRKTVKMAVFTSVPVMHCKYIGIR